MGADADEEVNLVGILVLLVPVGMLVAIVLWVRRSRPVARPGDDGRRTAAPKVAGRISLLTEAIVYIGAILVLAGGIVAIRQQWHRFGDATQLAILASSAFVFLAIGAFARSSTEPALERLTSVTWAISVGACAGAIAVVDLMYETAPETAFLTIATITTAYAIALWAVHPRAVQHAVMFVGLLVSAASILTITIHDPEPWTIALTLWGIGVAWAALGWTRRLEPWWMAVPLGLLVALIAPANMNVDPATYALGIGTAGAVMALSVVGRFSPGLGLGAVAMFGYLVGMITRYFGDTIGVPAALAVTGFLILILAAASARLLRYMRRGSGPSEGSAEEAGGAGWRKAA
jgi:hypothetical protein